MLQRESFHFLTAKSNIVFVVLSSMIAYRCSGRRLPAAMLSVTHSGFTTWIGDLDFFVKNFCVFEPLSGIEVTMWVAPDGVGLQGNSA